MPKLLQRKGNVNVHLRILGKRYTEKGVTYQKKAFFVTGD
jgi:hypothetical protein